MASFLAALAQQADCEICLLDITTFVNASNHALTRWSISPAMQSIAFKRRSTLAGYEQQGSFLSNTHGRPVQSGVWSRWFKKALERFGAVPPCNRMDTNIPCFDDLKTKPRKAENVSCQSQPQSELTSLQTLFYGGVQQAARSCQPCGLLEPDACNCSGSWRSKRVRRLTGASVGRAKP